LGACQHDPIIPPKICEGQIFQSPDSCITLPPPLNITFGYDLAPPDFLFRRPVFNPNNGDEMLYIKVEGEYFNPYTELRIVNLCTGEDRFVTDKASFNPDWSVKDWIIFEDAHFKIWKIKSNGDSLIQLTFNHQQNHPKWSPDGTMFFQFQKDRTPNGNLFLMDESGNTIQIQDSTLGGWGSYSWSPDGTRYAFPTGASLGIASIENILVDIFPGISPAGVITSVIWHPTEEIIYWNDGEGFYTTNLITRETQTLFERCGTNQFHAAFSISPNLDRIVMEQIYYTKIGDNLLLQEFKLISLDMDGRNEQRIVLE